MSNRLAALAKKPRKQLTGIAQPPSLTATNLSIEFKLWPSFKSIKYFHYLFLCEGAKGLVKNLASMVGANREITKQSQSIFMCSFNIFSYSMLYQK